jgi:Flp pilus assembly protein TadG
VARRAPTDERGAATAEMVIAAPALLFLCLLVVQVGLWFHASHVASAAAQEAARAARAEQGTQADGEQAARDLLDDLGRTLVSDVTIVVQRDAETARAVVDGYGPEVVPFVRIPVHAVSEGPVERFRAP